MAQAAKHLPSKCSSEFKPECCKERKEGEENGGEERREKSKAKPLILDHLLKKPFLKICSGFSSDGKKQTNKQTNKPYSLVGTYTYN
jgi:hypothetical protein